jgi:hypothetical protein
MFMGFAAQSDINLIMIFFQSNLDGLRTMKFSPMYQMTFSLMNEDPSGLQVDWDIEAAVNSKTLLPSHNYSW